MDLSGLRRCGLLGGGFSHNGFLRLLRLRADRLTQGGLGGVADGYRILWHREGFSLGLRWLR
jgi:hypothetical protein